jgi:tetratricopeptide (TPR) repeat protein
VDIWSAIAPAVDQSSLVFGESQGLLSEIYPQFERAREQLEAQDVAGACTTLMQMRTDAGGILVGRILIASGWMLQQIGRTYNAVDRINKGSNSSAGSLNDLSALANAVVGQDQAALLEFIRNLPAHSVSMEMTLLWASLCAVYAQSEAAIELLKEIAGTSREPMFIGFLLRALALRGHSLDVGKTAERFGQQHQLPGWLVRRMKEEAMLESQRDFERLEAFERLVTLQTSENVPLLHRADIAHNLGVIREDMGQSADAVRWYQAALALNPLLDLTREGLMRLGIFVPPAS